MKSPKFVLFPGKDQQFYFRLRATNAEPILASEGYTRKASCTDGIASVKENSPDDDRYERKTSKDDKPYFVLVPSNGEPIGTSETYESTEAMENGIEAVKRDAPGAPIEDLT